MSATTNLYLQQIRASQGPGHTQQKQASVENTVPISQQEMLKESSALFRGGARLAGRAAEGLGGKLTRSGETAFKNWGGDLMNMGSTRKGLGSMFGGWAAKLKRMGQTSHNPGNALITRGSAPRSVGTTLDSGPTIPMGMHNPNTGMIPHRAPAIDGKFEVMPSAAPAGMPSALGLPAPRGTSMPSALGLPAPRGTSMPSALGLPAPSGAVTGARPGLFFKGSPDMQAMPSAAMPSAAMPSAAPSGAVTGARPGLFFKGSPDMQAVPATKLHAGGPSGPATPHAPGIDGKFEVIPGTPYKPNWTTPTPTGLIRTSGPSGPSGGFGGMMDSIKGWTANKPWVVPAAGAAGAGYLGNQMGQSSGHNQGMNDAFNMYQQRSSGIGGNLRTLGNALGLVDDRSMFMGKGASHSKGASHHEKMAHFLGAVCQSNIETEQMFKQAFGGIIGRGVAHVGKSIGSSLAKNWGNIAGKAGQGLVNSAGTAAARTAGAGGKRLAMGNKLNNLGQRMTGWADETGAVANKAIDQASGWGGSLARGTRMIGRGTADFTAGPLGAGVMGWGAVDGLMNRKSWSEEGARRGAAQTLRGAENMTMGQRLGFLFNPSHVAGQAAQQADGTLPGVLDEYNKLR